MLDQVLEIAGIIPDHDLDIMLPNQSLDELTARLLREIGRVLDEEKPDRVVVQGDTATAMVGALAAYYRKIPVSHVEAGLRSGNIHHPWPEEVNRKIIGTIADQHFAPTDTARDALLIRKCARRSRPCDRQHRDRRASHHARLDRTQNPALAAQIDPILAPVRRTSGSSRSRRTGARISDRGLRAMARAVRRIAERPDVAVIFPVHPNPNVRAPDAGGAGRDWTNVAMIDPLDYPNFVALLARCHLVLTDSGGVQEEAPALAKPVLVMRETTERPEGVVAGTARLVGSDEEAIVAATLELLDDPEDAYAAMARAHNPFGDGKSSDRIARTIVNAR
jgi:UDP-N-acetylglucosamine 2-epimerase (non-hydrolysing)